MDNSDDVTADDLFRPFTFEKFVEQNMTDDFDKSFKHQVAVTMLEYHHQNGTHLSRVKAIWETKSMKHVKSIVKEYFVFILILIFGALAIFLVSLWLWGLTAWTVLVSLFGFVIGSFGFVWRVATPLPGPQLLIKYKEANQDAIIRDHAPHDLYSGIYYGWPGYHSANKTDSTEDIIAKRIERGNKSDSSMISRYQSLFSKNSVITPKSYLQDPHKWALVGVWALDTPKPEEKGKWDARPEFEAFAKKEFANAVLARVKSSNVLKPRRKREFEENFSIESFFENIMSTSDKDNADVMALEGLLNLQKRLK